MDTEVVVVSDADCFWPADILEKTVPFLSDPDVGAVCAREMLLNPEGSWVTKGEEFFDDTMVGEIQLENQKFIQQSFFTVALQFSNGALLTSLTQKLMIQAQRWALCKKSRERCFCLKMGFFTPFPIFGKTNYP